jgi:hypothetical protein
LVVVCFGWKLLSEEMVKQCYVWLENVKEALLMIANVEIPQTPPPPNP